MTFGKRMLAANASALSLIPALAMAQTSVSDDAATTQADIIVTGSRVIANGNKSPTPVTVIPVEQILKVQPSTIVDAVNLAPALQGSQALSSPPGGGQRNGAAAYFNLRGLGDLRTLVLMDGNRVVPTINAFGGNTDAFVVPQLLIQRVDVVTGGVSAVYGSDAVSGVVNFVTDKSFSGVKIQGSTGISQYGDGAQVDLGVAAGKTFAGGRGHVEFSYEYRSDAGIPNQLSRPYFARSIGGAGAGTAADPYYRIENTRLSNTSFGGLITNGPFTNFHFAQDGVLSPFNVGNSTGTTGVSSGGDGGWYDTASLKSTLQFHQFFGRIDYDLTDDVNFHVQGAGTINHTSSSFRAPLLAATLSYQNPFAKAVPQLAAQALLTPNGTFRVSKLFRLPPTANQYTDTYMFHGGLDGTFGGYKWSINAGHSVSQLEAHSNNNVDQAKFFAAVNAVRTATGEIVCNAALTNQAYAGCVPLNMLGPTATSPEALAYVLTDTYNRNRTILTEANGSVSGAPFSTWAGPVNMALSAEWRRISWSVAGNASPTDPVNCTGIQFNCPATRWLSTVQPQLPKVHQDVKELAYEVNVPLASTFDLNGAVRYTDYSTSGTVWTWKAGFIWQPSDQLTVRGTASRDIRAPNLFDLFSPRTATTVNIFDPLLNTSLNGVPLATISNTRLTPERAQSFTGGFVFTPSFIPHLSVTLDAYYIKINNAITQLNGNSAIVQNLCRDTRGANPACVVIQRPNGWNDTSLANAPTQLYNQYLNIAAYKTYGADFEINYTPEMFSRPLMLRALLSYQPKAEYDQGPAGVVQLAGAATGLNPFFGIPKFKYTLIASYDVTDQVNLTWMQRGRGTMHVSALVEGQAAKVFAPGQGDNPPTSYSNVTLTFKMDNPGRSEFFLNVQNLFNKQPNVYYPGPNAQPGLGQVGFFPPNGDDTVGRYFSAGFRMKF